MRCETEATIEPNLREASCDEILGNLVELAGLFIGGRVPNLNFVEFARSIEMRAPSHVRPGATRGSLPVMFLRRRAA